MLEFAVTVNGLNDGKAHWVLAVQGNRLLIVHDDRSLHWHPMDECRLGKVASPDMPRPVVPVQPTKQPLVVPTHGRVDGY